MQSDHAHTTRIAQKQSYSITVKKSIKTNKLSFQLLQQH